MSHEKDNPIDPMLEDAALAERLISGVCGARDELLALNPVSLVHRVCLSHLNADTVLLMYAAAADAAGKEKLIAALLSAVDSYRTNVPDINDMETLTARFSRSIERRRADVGRAR